MSDVSANQGPLFGIRVLDITSVIMGPFATSLLADLGADVIKVESKTGDPIRHYNGRHSGMSGMFMNINRNKRSIVVDIGGVKGREILLRIASSVDVVLHNLLPERIEAIGLTYEAVRSANPNIIYCSATGFGSNGPYRNRPAYDDVIQAGSGLAGLYEKKEGEPAYAPFVVADKVNSYAVAYAISAALVRRLMTGSGGKIEVPMFETAIAFNMVEHYGGACFEPPIEAIGFSRLLAKSRRPFRVSDGFVCLMPYSDANWEITLNYLSASHLIGTEEFGSLKSRAAYADIVYSTLSTLVADRTTGELLHFCDTNDIPFMPVTSIDSIEADVHVRAVDLFRHDSHPTEGSYKYVRNAIMIDDRIADLRRHAPALGEHTSEILREAGFTAEEIDAVSGSTMV